MKVDKIREKSIEITNDTSFFCLLFAFYLFNQLGNEKREDKEPNREEHLE